MKLDATINVRAVQRELEALKPRIAERVIVASLNRAITGVRTEAVKELRRVFNLPARGLRNRLLIRKATRARAEAAIYVKRDYDPPLAFFRPRWRQRQPVGASVQLRAGSRTVVPGAFVAVTVHGRPGVFRRTGQQRASKNIRPGRKTDEELKFLRSSDAGGPTLVKALLEDSANRSLRGSGRQRFIAEARRLAARDLALGRGNRARLQVT